MPYYFMRPLELLPRRTDGPMVVNRVFLNTFLLTAFFTIAALTFPTTSFAQATICGYVFLDANQNGIKDTGELARANHIVYLDDLTLMMNDQGGNFSTTTDANGHYCFLANSIGGYGYWLRTDIPENSTFLTTPMRVDLKTGAMPPHSVQVTGSNQKVSVNFGFIGVVDEETPIFCQSEEKDKSVCVHNSQFLMQVTPNNEATEVRNMDVEVVKDDRGKDAYIGDNNTSVVAVVEKEFSTKRLLRDGKSEDFVITVGKDLSDDGEEFSLDARINADGSVSFSEQDVPNVVATSTQYGFIVTDSESPTVSVEVANNGDITATDSDDPTMGLFINGSTGEVAVTDTESPDTLAVINPNGSFDITDSQFPDLVATVYGDGYVIKDIKNDVVVKIDSQGNYSIIDNANQVCIELPRTRGFLSKWWKKLKNIIASVMRFVNKIIGFIGKVARFVARVAPIISKALRVVAVVARVAAVMFPPLCKFFCAIAAFAESAALFSDKVGFFASQVANIAEAIQRGDFSGFWVGNYGECNTRRKVREGELGQEGGVILKGEVSAVVNAGVLAGQALMSQLLCRDDGNSNEPEPQKEQIISLMVIGNGTGKVTSTPAGINCRTDQTCLTKKFTSNITLTAISDDGDDGNEFVSWGGACSGNSATCSLLADNTSKMVTATFRRECDFNKSPNLTVQKCFGAIGSQCDDFLPIIHFDKNENTCKATGGISSGSILHDLCCYQNGDIGVWCSRSGPACEFEWELAYYTVTNGRDFVWQGEFGPYYKNGMGDSISIPDLIKKNPAPDGTKVTDPEYCSSKSYSMTDIQVKRWLVKYYLCGVAIMQAIP